MACLTFIQIQRKGSVHPIRVSRAFLIKAGGEGWGDEGALCLCAVIGALETAGAVVGGVNSREGDGAREMTGSEIFHSCLMARLWAERRDAPLSVRQCQISIRLVFSDTAIMS